MNNSGKCRFNHEDIFKCANSRLGWYRRSGLDVVNFILSPTVLGNKIFMNNSGKCRFNHEDIFKCANSRLGWYRRSGLDVVNFILSPTVLGNKTGDRPGLVHPLDYYLKSL